MGNTSSLDSVSAMASSHKLTYRQQLFGLLILFGVLLMASFLSFQHGREREFQAERLNHRLQLINLHIAQEWQAGKEVEKLYDRYQYEFEGLRLTLIDSTGTVLYDSEATERIDQLSNHLDRSEVQQALRSGSGHTVRRHSSSTERDYFYSAYYDKGIIIRTALPYDWTLSQSLSVENGYVWITILITCLVSIVAFFMTRHLTQNIARLRLFSQKLDRGEPITNLGEFPDDELGELSKHIVDLYRRLQQALSDADREHHTALEQEQEKIRIKRQLTNNINHELKTPISAIRGYMESLLMNPDMDPALRQSFIEKSYAQTERLQQLLQDISLVTRMEEAPRMINRETCDLKKIIDEVCRELEPKWQGQIEIICNIPNELPIFGNTTLLGSIFRNLMENAIAYSGGNRIEIQLLNQSSEAYRFRFADNGSGVEAIHLSRLFERFYRIDKGRSRKLGGTGLGLSIVKNAILFHAGSIEARNCQSGGLEFLFTLARHA